MDNTQQLNFFQRIDIHFLQIIAEFLSPKDITQVVQISKSTRLLFGQILSKSLEKQKNYFKNKEQSYLQSSQDDFKEYQQTLKQSKIFCNKQNFDSLLSQLNSKNLMFFKNFFSAVFDRDIKLDKQNLLLQKNGLSQMHNEVKIALQSMINYNKIPSVKVYRSQCIGFISKKVQGVVKFVNKFLQNIENLQSYENIEKKLKEFTSNQRYLYEFKNILKLSLQRQYQKPIYYLTFNKSYHHFIGFNVNTIIFSFLPVQDLQNLYDVDFRFACQIIKSFDILQNRVQRKQEHLETVKFDENTMNAYVLYKACQKTNITKRDVCELRAYVFPPPAFQLTISTFMNIFSIRLKERFGHNIHIITFENKEAFLMSQRNEITSFNEKQLKVLESYFEQVSEKQIQNYNIFCYKIYIYLKLNYLANKFNISEYSLNQIQQNEFSKEKLHSYSSSLDVLKKQIQNNQKEQEESLSQLSLNSYYSYRIRLKK